MIFASGFKSYRERFGFREGWRQYLLNGLRKRLEPGARFAYSLAGEDLCLATFFKGRQHGYYVDVGCGHPKRISNTFYFYRAGWSGLCIDANEDFVRDWKAIRPRDRFVHAAVSANKQEVLYHRYASSEFNTIGCGAVTPLSGGPGPRLLDSIPMETRTLSEIAEENSVPKNFEFLSVDVEGVDVEVLRSLDFTRWRPRVICIEAHEFNVLEPCVSPIVTYCDSVGYDFLGYLILNAFFVQRERG